MAKDNETYIVKQKDTDAIVRLQDPTAMQEFLEQPLTIIAEVLTGWLASGPTVWAGAGLRIAHAAFKARVFQQFSKELKELRQKGEICGDFAEKKNGYESWVELLTILDEEVPNEDRLDALKAMFFGVNRTNISDGERILNYQLFQIAKSLHSGELLLLKTSYQRFLSGHLSQGISKNLIDWCREVAQLQGHYLTALMEKNERALVDQGLLSPRSGNPGAPVINDFQGRMTDLGIKFCENLESYKIETAPKK